MRRVLVVDDEAGVRDALRFLLEPECEVVEAAGTDPALDILAQTPVDLAILDLVMPGRSGLELLAELQTRGEAPPVIVLSATHTIATAVEAMRLGAADYVTKPFEVDALRIKVRRLLEQRELVERVAALRVELDERIRLDDLIGRSHAMHAVFRTIERVACSDVSVLIKGESGTGKELVARAIHRLGPRAERPFVAINCGAIPTGLLESELFGHERGAFTDALERHVGRFEAAHGGTLFLDEIGELAPELQVKLLRALQERAIERVGGSRPIAIDVRVVAATNRDLETEIEVGRFRPDLYYRIHVVPVEMPPLRERRDDVRLLAEHFLTRARERAGRGPARIARSALAALERYAWPGNVRELENAIEHAVALAESEVIEPHDLPAPVMEAERSDALREAVRVGRIDLEHAVASFEQELLREGLERCGWNQTRAAERLGITRRLLKLKMDRHALAPPSEVVRDSTASGSSPASSPRGGTPPRAPTPGTP